MMSAKAIVQQMLNHDLFSQWLDINIVEILEGKCTISIKVNGQMTNGFKIAHGGIAYSLADSCAAFTANSFGKIAVTKESKIKYLKKAFTGDKLTASCVTSGDGKKNLEVSIENQDNELIAVYSCKIHYTSKHWTV